MRKVPGIISRKEWDVILDAVNEIGSVEDRSHDMLKAMYHNSLAKYRLPDLFND